MTCTSTRNQADFLRYFAPYKATAARSASNTDLAAIFLVPRCLVDITKLRSENYSGGGDSK